jgi:hypothetical protein
MSDQSAAKVPLHERALEEFKELLILTFYLYICFGALMLQKTVVLRDAGISFDMWGIALVKALLLAKFMLVGRALHIGQQRYRHEALIWPTLYQSVLTLLLLLVLDAVEEVLVGLIHSRALVDSLAHVAGSSPLLVGANCLIMLLILVPYFAFQNLSEVLGDRTLVRLFLVDRRTPVSRPSQM